MKGGMSRRYTLFKTLRDDGLSQAGRHGRRRHGERFRQTGRNQVPDRRQRHEPMRYNSAALGLSDLKLPTGESPFPGHAAPPPVPRRCSSAETSGLFAFDEKMLPRTQLIKSKDGFKDDRRQRPILGKTYQAALAGNTESGDGRRRAKAAGRMAVPMPKKAKKRANSMVLLAHAKHDEAIALAKKYPDFNLVVCSDGGAEPPAQAEDNQQGRHEADRGGREGDVRHRDRPLR